MNKRTEWKRGRFIYNHDFNYWICTGCGYKIANAIPVTPYCPYCDKPNGEKPMIYRDIDEVIDSD